MDKTIFIIAPSSLYPEDIVHHVASTTVPITGQYPTECLGAIYDDDDYEVEGTFGSMEEARAYAKELGEIEPEVI